MPSDENPEIPPTPDPPRPGPGSALDGYARYVEYGTRRRGGPASRWLRDALSSRRPLPDLRTPRGVGSMTPEVKGDTLTIEVATTLHAAHGPLTVEEIRKRLGDRLGGYIPYGDVYVRLQRLGGAGWVDTMKADRCRIWWWTKR